MNAPHIDGIPAGIIPAEEIARYQQRVETSAQARAEPLPGPVFEAFGDAALEHAGIKLRPVVAYDMVILRKLNSPLYRRVLELSKPKEEQQETAFEDDEAFEMIYQFATPLPEVRATLAKGRQHYREIALQAIGDKLPIGAAARLVELAGLNLARAFSTVVNYQAPPSDDGTVFQTPPAGTASAGGSN